MNCFVNKDNVKTSKVSFPESVVDQTYHLPTLSEMISECRRTGQMPYSNIRPIAPTYTDDISSPSYGAEDKIDAYLQQVQRASEIESKEKSLEEMKHKLDNPEPEPTTAETTKTE